MNRFLEQHIQDYGWKNWTLAFLKEKEEFWSNILNHVLLWKWDNLSEKQRQEIISFNSNKIIVRTSEQSDWEWMVDVMPTIVCTKNELDKVLSEIKEKSYNKEIIEYSKKEQTNYNPDNISISIAPFIESEKFTLTEHPNQKWKLLLDIYDERNWWTDTDVIDLLDKEIINKFDYFSMYNNKEQIKWILDIMTKLREIWIFSEDRSLQIEWWINLLDWNANLYQVKDFSRIELPNYELEKNLECEHSRIFWLTWEKWIELPISNWHFRYESIDNWEEKYPNWYLSSPSIITNPLSSEYGKNMKWYMPWNSLWSRSLAHQNTRFVQQVLKEWGFAILDKFYIWGTYQDWVNLNIKSDGKNFEIEKI